MTYNEGLVLHDPIPSSRRSMLASSRRRHPRQKRILDEEVLVQTDSQNRGYFQLDIMARCTCEAPKFDGIPTLKSSSVNESNMLLVKAAIGRSPPPCAGQGFICAQSVRGFGFTMSVCSF
jgi:hypothetical protein